MGHTNADVTINVYTQVLDASLRTAVDRIGSELFAIVHSLQPRCAGIAHRAARTQRLQWSVMEFKRITTNPAQMGGVPCLRGLRIPVATIVALVAEGQMTEEILALYPDLDADDVREALLFAAEAVRERVLPLAASE